MNDEDFCPAHGRDHMKCDNGPIPYCTECQREEFRHMMQENEVTMSMIKEMADDFGLHPTEVICDILKAGAEAKKSVN